MFEDEQAAEPIRLGDPLTAEANLIGIGAVPGGARGTHPVTFSQKTAKYR